MALSLFPPGAPCLPNFQSLLVTGEYPPSSPLHLCISEVLSRLSNNAAPVRVLFITRSRQDLVSQLETFNDGWLTKNSGHGKVAEALRCIDIICCPTAARWLSLMEYLRLNDTSAPLPASGPFDGVLNAQPSLIVLHEPSDFFIEPSAHEFSLYVQLAVSALVTSSYLENGSTTRIALFDSKLQHLKLPLLKKELAPQEESGPNPQKDSRRRELVLPAVSRYFEWHAACQLIRDLPLIGLVPRGPKANAFRMTLENLTMPASPTAQDDNPFIDNETANLFCTWTQEAEQSSSWTSQSSVSFRFG